MERVSVAAPASGRVPVVTDRGTWRARHVVIATGPHGMPHVPAGRAVRTSRWSPRSQYRNPAQLPPAGSSSSAPRRPGCRSRTSSPERAAPVVLAVGRHTRMPRRYRGMDIFWWLASTGRLARTIDDVPDVSAARREPSLQLVGRTSTGCAEPRPGRAAARTAFGSPGDSSGSPEARAWFRDDLAGTVARRRAADAPLPRRGRRVRGRAGLDARVVPATATAGDRRAGDPGPGESARRADQHHPARHRLSPASPVAAAADHRAGREHRAAPRRYCRARCVRGRPAIPAPPRLRHSSTAPGTTPKPSSAPAQPGRPARRERASSEEPAA